MSLRPRSLKELAIYFTYSSTHRNKEVWDPYRISGVLLDREANIMPDNLGMFDLPSPNFIVYLYGQ